MGGAHGRCRALQATLLAHNFAKNTFGEKSITTMSSAQKLVCAYLQTGMAARTQHIGKDLLKKKEKRLAKTT
jgi:hypothetical protein